MNKINSALLSPSSFNFHLLCVLLYNIRSNDKPNPVPLPCYVGKEYEKILSNTFEECLCHYLNAYLQLLTSFFLVLINCWFKSFPLGSFLFFIY